MTVGEESAAGLPHTASAGRELALGLARARIDEGLLSAALRAGIRRLDTAYNYGGFEGLDQLGELRAPQRFAITSKVGFFRSSDGSGIHALDPDLLYHAVEDTVRRLRAPLDTILLHNPEEAVAGSPTSLENSLGPAAEALVRAVHDGLAGRWGISVWRPDPVWQALRRSNIRPDVLMTRAGLGVGPDAMVAVNHCRHAVTWPGIEFRGMAPYGGSRAARLLRATDLTSFVDGRSTNAQAALRLSFELPEVRVVAFGTSNPAHMREAMAACAMEIDHEQFSAYRDILSLQTRPT
ncbi:aldo/keto reductase [Nocardia sp. NPDC004750]